MARNNINYSEQLSDIGAPTDGGAGRLFERAGVLQGEAKATDINTNTQALSFLGTQGVAATKGYLEAKEEKEIQETLDNTDGLAKSPIADEARAFNNNQVAIAGVMEGMGATYRPELAAMSSEAKRIQDAQAQGLLSKEEALLRIGATVKKYSAMMPGWASDFRKVAANLTGLSNVDTMAVHNFFTQKTAREREAEKVRDAQLQLDKELASSMGIALTDITPAHRAAYTTYKQTGIAQQQLDARMKIGNLSQDQADQSYGQMVMVDVAHALAGMNADLVRQGALNADNKTFLESQQFGLRLASQIEMAHNAVAQRIREWVKPDPSRPAYSFKAANDALDRVKKDFDQWREAVKTIEGRNAFLALVKKSENDANLLMNNFATANPMVAVLGKYGVLPPLFQSWLAPKSRQDIDKLLDGPMGALLNPTGMQVYSGVFGQAVSQPGLNLRAPGVAPEIAKATTADLLRIVEEWPKDVQPTPEKVQAFSYAVGNLGNNLTFTVDKDIDTTFKFMTREEFNGFVGKLDIEQRTRALTPIALGVEKAFGPTNQELQEALKQWNDPANNIAARAGWRLSVATDPVTGRMAVTKVKEGENALSAADRRMGIRGDGDAPALVGIEAQRAEARAAQLLNRLNKTTTIYYAAVGSIDPTLVGSKEDWRKGVLELVRKGSAGPLSEGFVSSVVLKNDTKATPGPGLSGLKSYSDTTERAVALRRKEGNAQTEVAAILDALKGATGTARQVLSTELKLWGFDETGKDLYPTIK